MSIFRKIFCYDYSTFPPKISPIGLIADAMYKFIKRIIYLFRPAMQELDEQRTLNAWWHREVEVRLQEIEKKLKFKGENDGKA